jgi:hypothetical protein
MGTVREEQLILCLATDNTRCAEVERSRGRLRFVRVESTATVTFRR